MSATKSTPAHPVLWRFAVSTTEPENPFRYDDARSLNVVRDVDGQERPFATSSVSTAYVKSDRQGDGGQED